MKLPWQLIVLIDSFFSDMKNNKQRTEIKLVKNKLKAFFLNCQ